MKLIPKNQKGGSFRQYYAKYTPIDGPESLFRDSGTSSSKKAKSSSGSGSDSEKGKLTEKDLFSMLKDIDGLPNEMRTIFAEVQEMYGASSISGSSLATIYATAMNEIKQANFNKKQYDQVITQINNNQGMNDFAVTAGGNVVVYNKDKEVVAVPVQEYMQNRDQYRALTNSNIMSLRAHDPKFAYRNGDSLLEIASNAIGMNKVEGMLRDRLQNLGTTEQEFQGYTRRQGDTIQQGVQILEQIAAQNQSDGTNLTVEGLYKTKVLSKEQKNQAEAAVRYIYETLPSNAQAILQLHSGNSSNPIEGACRVIQDLVTQGISSTFHVEHAYESNLNPDGSKRKDPKDLTDDEKLNIAQQWLMGAGTKETFTINPGTNLATEVTTVGMPLVSKEGTILQVGDSLKDVTSSQQGGILNWNKATMGNKKIKPGAYDQILLTDNIVRLVDYPVNPDGTPDLNPKTLENVQKYRRLAKEQGIDLNDPNSVRANSQTLNAILQECDLPVAFDSQGNYLSGRWAQFGVLQGVTTSNALVSDGSNNYSLFRDIKDRSEIDTYKRIMEKNLSSKLDFDYDDWGIFEGDYTHMLEGTIWVPIYNNIFNAGAGSGVKLDPNLMNERIIQQDISDRYAKQQELRSRYNQLEL